MINRRELILGTATLPILSVPAMAFQLPEDRLISKAQIIMDLHKDHAQERLSATWAIRQSLLSVYESERKYWAFLGVDSVRIQRKTTDGMIFYPAIAVVVYRGFGERQRMGIYVNHYDGQLTLGHYPPSTTLK